MTTAPSGQFLQDLISDIFGAEPERAYQGQVSKQGEGKGEAFQRFFLDQSNDYVQQYSTAVSRQLTEGQMPTLRPEDFFGRLNLQNELLKYSPEQRGMSTAASNPRTTFHYSNRNPGSGAQRV